MKKYTAGIITGNMHPATYFQATMFVQYASVTNLAMKCNKLVDDIIFIDIDSAGSLLDFSIVRDSEQLRLAVLSKVQEKCLVTLLTMPDHILCGGSLFSIKLLITCSRYLF